MLSGFIGLTGGGNAISGVHSVTFGGLVVLAGLVALLVITATSVAVVRSRVSSLPLLALVGGLTALVAMVVLTTWSRAGIVKNDLRDYNRYIQVVAIFLVLAFLPTLVDIARSGNRGRDRRRTTLAVAVVLLVFVLNLSPASSYRQTFESWATQTRVRVARSVGVLDRGCAAGSTPNPQAEPLGSLDPQISVSLLQTLREKHVAMPHTRSAGGGLAAAICARRPTSGR